MITIENSTKSRRDWIAFSQLNEEVASAVLSADVILLPSEYEQSPLAFPLATRDLFASLQSSLGDKLEICINDEDFVELELNSRVLRMPKILVTSVLLPVILNLVCAFVYDRYLSSKQESVNVDVNVEVAVPEFQKPVEMDFTIEVEDSATGKSKSFHYEGTAAGFKESADEILKMWDEEKNK